MDIDLSLPMSVEKLVPHRPPVLLVNSIIDFSGETGIIESVIEPDNIFLEEDGSLPEVTTIEIMAQASAAVKGYSDLKQGKDIKKGFLVDIRKSVFNGKCYSRDILRSRIEITKSFSGFSVVDGRLERSGEELANAVFKLWVPGESEE